MAKSKLSIKESNSKRQEMFCREFIVDLIGTQAAIRAGYSERTARSKASQLLTKVNIRTRIAALMEERSKQTMVDAAFVVANLIDISHKCQQKVPVLVFDPITKGLIQKTDEDGNNVWEFDSTGANKALELLGRHLAMFTDKIKTTVQTEQPLFPDSK